MKNSALIGAVVLAVMLAAGWLMATVAERRRREMRGRLTAVLTGNLQRSTHADGSVSLRRTDRTHTGRSAIPMPAGFRHWLTRELGATGDRLGIPSLVLAAVVGAVAATTIVAGVLDWPLLVTAPTALAAAVFAAKARLDFSQRRFQRQFVDRFPDALDVIVRAVRAGLPVLDALEAAATSGAEPIVGELNRVLDELRIGNELDEVLERAGNRIRVNDFRFFAATIVLQRRTGGSLADTLSNLSGLIRRRKEVRLKARSLSAESRATAYLLGALPFVVSGLMYLLNPDTMKLLFTDPRGKTILSIAVGLLVMGFWLMNSMIKRASR